MITKNLPERKKQWSQRFSKALELREERKISSEQAKKTYIQKFVNSNSVTGFVDRERELEPISYVEDSHGSRNSLCSVCNVRVERLLPHTVCDLCPALAHDACAQSIECSVHTYLKHFTEKYRLHIQSKVNADGFWCCSLCSKEIGTSIEEERKRLKDDRFKRMAFFSAIKLQANCMRFKAQRRYRILYTGIRRLQARVSIEV